MPEKKLEGDATLGFLIKEGHVWLGIKTRNIGKGLRNGYGGGMDPGDKDLEECLKREVKQESGVNISTTGLEKVAIINFHNTTTSGETFTTKVHVFLIKDWTGEPQATEEMIDPKEFEIKDLPLGQMMVADKEWLPLVFAGKKIIAEYHYGPFQKEFTKEGKVTIVATLPGENSKEFKIH